MIYTGLLIGVDFDNTIAGYDDVMHRIAVEKGLIPAGVQKSKRTSRDSIRQRPDGEIEWQRLQGIVYGPRMKEATLITGVQAFLGSCKRHEIPIAIISHKTEYANYDATGTNLRQVSKDWMRRKRLFGSGGAALTETDVYFESTRHEKIQRIKSLKCTHFIDDLEETFLDSSFPTSVESILYAPYRRDADSPGVRVAKNWKEISDYLFGR